MEIKKPDNNLVLSNFNNRDYIAFGEVYSLYYMELYGYASSLYKNTTEDPEDILQDIFLKILSNKSIKFSTLKEIKNYIYVSIKNRYISYYRHHSTSKHIDINNCENEASFIFQAAEAEIISLIPEILNMIPSECAKVIKLSLQGYDIKEIADKLEKKESTIYNQRKTAISILKTKLPKDKIFIIALLLN